MTESTLFMYHITMLLQLDVRRVRRKGEKNYYVFFAVMKLFAIFAL